LKLTQPQAVCQTLLPIASNSFSAKPQPILDCHRSQPSALAKLATIVAQSLQLT
jgi:hypothetical protein